MSVKHITWIVSGAIILWLVVGCSTSYRTLDSTSSSQSIDKKPPKKIFI